MIKTQYLIIAAGALFLLVLSAGILLVGLPIIFDSQVQPAPGATDTGGLASPTPLVIVITSTPEPTQPVTAAPTEVPTITPVPTATTPPTPTANPIPCDWASFVTDITVKDGTDMIPGESFVKTWRIKNIGSCTWTTDYDLVFSSGNDMDAANVIQMPGTVRPGESIDISVGMDAPDDEGKYTGYWMFRNPSGKFFGIGDSQSSAIWVSIDVVLPCYWAGFGTDVTVPDGTNFSPGTTFVKTWRLKNIGDCSWNTSFDIVYVSGSKLGNTVADIPQRVRPGETVDVSVTLTAPTKTGDYRGYWMIRADDGTVFGLGSEQDSPFWVDIEVLDADNDYIYDFAANYCAAVWKSGVGLLSCPGQAEDPNGFVIRLSNPNLENRRENEPALWTAPNTGENKWISGKFPAIRIEEGYRFKAWVGCLEGSEDCNVTFYLDYQIDGGLVKSLGQWDEVYDGEITIIDIDLSSLADENVTFILSVDVNGGDPKEADAFWFVPRIE